MTYKELLSRLQELYEDQLSCDLVVFDRKEEEYMPAEFDIASETSVLGKEYPFIFF